ncbi:MAG: riboflavin biosynthesis protein RibF [Planctomycetota bacterium]
MQVYRSLRALDGAPPLQAVATVGVFDGVHLGHQHLLAALRDWASEVGRPRAVVTFDRHPLSVLGRIPPAILTSVEHRLVLLEREGVDLVVVLTFDRELASWSPERFVGEILGEALGCRHLLMGHDSALGSGARGTFEYLRDRPGLDLELRSVPPFRLDGKPVSSTDIRAAVLKGELQKAAALLGRPLSLFGEVIAGDGRGRQLGFPTANLNLFHSAAPPHGVYLADARVDDVQYPALVNIGRRPTFLDDTVPLDYSRYFNEQLDKVEVFVSGLDRDLYGLQLEARLHEKIRDEKRFGSVEALVTQIRLDLERLQEWWGRRTNPR